MNGTLTAQTPGDTVADPSVKTASVARLAAVKSSGRPASPFEACFGWETRVTLVGNIEN